MPIKITFIGLGQFGASMGLALAPHKESIQRIGHDLLPERERSALTKNAIDKAEHNLPSAARGAKLIVLSIPAARVIETLEFITPDLPENAIVLDCSPIQTAAEDWARKNFPAGCAYVGLTLALNPQLLHDFSFEQDSARADLFANAVCLVAPAPNISETAANLAVDFVRLLGAQPVLADVYEADGLSAATHLLPQFLSAALVSATIDQPGWSDARKLASRAYAAVSSGLAHDDALSLSLSARENRPAMLNALDRTIDALRLLRNEVAQADENQITARLESTRAAHQRWLAERLAAAWDAPTKPNAENAPSFWKRLMGGAQKK
ncbi:MAG: prephenate/arogenate dehydrogenase [Anaerolineales bacterium]